MDGRMESKHQLSIAQHVSIKMPKPSNYFSGHLSHCHIPTLTALHLHLLQGSSPLTFVANIKRLSVLIGGLGVYDGHYCAWGGFAVCTCIPMQWPTAGATAGLLLARQPTALAIGSLELIHPAEPCKAPFVPSCRLDQAGDRYSSLDWLSVSQPMAIHIQAQAQAQPSHHQIKDGWMGAWGGWAMEGMEQNCATWIPSQCDHCEKGGKEHAGGKEYWRGGFQQEFCLLVNRAGYEQDHYLAPNLSSGTALKGCLCLGLMWKAQDAMSEGNNQHRPFITLAACAPGQGPLAHFCGDEIYDKPLSEAESRQQSSNTHRPPGILWPP